MSAAEFEAVIPQVPDTITRNNLRGHLVHALLAEDDVVEAERASDLFEPHADQDERFRGHRRVALWFALRGDAAGFFARWRRLAAGRERHHMGELKKILVESVARERGWDSALTVTDDKRLGPAYRRCAFAPMEEQGEVEQLCEVFDSPAGSGVLDELDELQVLTGALYARVQHTGVATREPLTRVLHRIVAIGPSDKHTMRVRDWMMLHLWSAYPDAETLALARKSVRTPNIRRQLTALHPNIARPGRDE